MIVDFLHYTIIAAVPLFLATLGELLAEKSGSLNLGLEGMMLIGAVTGFICAYTTSNAGLAIAGALAAGALAGLIFAFLTVSLHANQVVTGLTLTIFGTGFASFVGDPYIGLTVPKVVQTFFKPIEIPLLSDIPVLGHFLFDHDILVYTSYVLILITWLYLNKTRVGLNMRAVGENTAAADASGVNITAHKYVHLIIGGALCALGGAYLSLVRVPMFQADVVTGRGWIAVALVIFAAWTPGRAFLASLLFGALSIGGLWLQGAGVKFSQYIFDMLPYAATILIVIVSTMRNRKEDQPPANLSTGYFREDR
jgi:simple sugar transport system permease protein